MLKDYIQAALAIHSLLITYKINSIYFVAYTIDVCKGKSSRLGYHIFKSAAI